MELDYRKLEECFYRALVRVERDRMSPEQRVVAEAADVERGFASAVNLILAPFNSFAMRGDEASQSVIDDVLRHRSVGTSEQVILDVVTHADTVKVLEGAQARIDSKRRAA